MSMQNAWPEDSPDWLYEHAVDEIVRNLGMYRRYRIEWLASHNVDVPTISKRLSLPPKVVERVLEQSGALDNP
jgi:hypothetical protein